MIETDLPMISVIMPCYNVSWCISDCIDSIKKNQYINMEILLVDDGSTDDTYEKIKNIALNDKRIRCFHTENNGVSAARNYGIEKSIGEYIFFVDPDDEVEETLFLDVVSAMEKENADYCVFDFMITGKQDNVNVLMNSKLRHDYNLHSNEEILDVYFPTLYGYSKADVLNWYKGEKINKNKEFGSVWKCAYKRKLLVDNDIRMDERISLNEDSMFNCEYMLYASRMISLRAPLYKYCLRESGAMNQMTHSEKMIINKAELLRKRFEISKKYKEITGKDAEELYIGSCVFSIIEMLAIDTHDKFYLKKIIEYYRDPIVQNAIKTFPLGGGMKVRIPVLMLRAHMFNTLRLSIKLLKMIGIKVSVK